MAPVDLIASAWTTAGDAAPQRGDEISPESLEDRIQWAADTGWAGVGLVHADLEALEQSGGSLDGLRQSISASGLKYVEVEFLVDWWTRGPRRTESDRIWADLLRAATELGALHIKVAGEFSGEPVDEAAMVSEMRRLGDQAAEIGTRIALEPIPMSNFRTVEAGQEFISTVNHPAVGLCVDIWHVMRGGTPIDSLPDFLDPATLFAVELNDAPSDAGQDAWADTIDNRRLIGAGDWDVTGFISAIRRVGFSGPWGVEILSTEYRARPVREALADAYDTTMHAFGSA